MCSSIRRRRYYTENKDKEKEKILIWNANNPIKKRIQVLRKYGITLEDYELLLQNQDYKCAICNKEQTKTLHVDHDHSTGIVRGLLCFHCNSLLGKAFDNIDILTNAITYLRKRI